MRITLNSHSAGLSSRTIAVFFMFGALMFGGLARPMSAMAESAFVQQSSGQVTTPLSLGSTPASGPSAGGRSPSRSSGGFSPTPELATPSNRNGNFAGTLQVGNANQTVQLQGGQGDTSNVGILGGSKDDVNVLQGGNNQQSNIVLLGISGVNVDVLQPKGSAPVNMLIARLPNGSLLIKR